MKFILFAGTWYRGDHYEKIWANLVFALKERYPGATFVYKHAWYQPWDIEKIQSLGERAVLDEDTGEDVVLLGHSMGGVNACGIAGQFKRSRVRGIVTIFSPHTMGGWLLPFLNFARMVYPNVPAPRAPIISFGGWFDPLVWFFFTRHPNAVHHVNVISDHHYMLGLNKGVASSIAETVGDIICP